MREKKILEFDNLEAFIPQTHPHYVTIANSGSSSAFPTATVITSPDGRRLRLVQRNTRKGIKVFVPPVKSRKRRRKKAGEDSGESSEGRRQFQLVSETQPLRQHAVVIR